MSLTVPEQKIHYNVYWAGQHSIVSVNGYVENYIKNVLENYHKNISFAIFGNDGLTDESQLSQMMNLLNKLDICIIGVLCSRYIQSKQILYLPLDDNIFHYGLIKYFENVQRTSWENKLSKCFWRGWLSGGNPSIRTQIVSLFIDNLNANVKFFDYHGRSPDIPEHYYGDYCDIAVHCQHKYLFILDGNCIASNHMWVFGSGSVPVMVTHPDNVWWFKDYLIPMVNYVPIKYDLSDAIEKIDWLIANDDKAKIIMKNAMQLAETLFSHDGQREYLDKKIKEIITGYDDTLV